MASSKGQALVPLKEQGEHQRHESIINLTLLEAPKHVVEAHQMTSQSGQRGPSSAPWMPEESRMMVAQVMTIGVTSIEEQLAQITEAIAKLMKTAEEKDLQIAALVNKLGARHYEGFSSDSKKGGDEEEGPPVEKAEEKLEPDQAAALMGYLSIKQLQEMIANTVKAQYKGSSNTSGLYSKPY
ncbi:hypothetical protein ACFX2B_034896 [Malus domestica]